jgi:hypothetical protein
MSFDDFFCNFEASSMNPLPYYGHPYEAFIEETRHVFSISYVYLIF